VTIAAIPAAEPVTQAFAGFDGTAAEYHELARPFGQIRLPLGTYFVTGNHEEFGSNTRFSQAVKDAGMTTLDDQKVEIDGVQIVGVDYGGNTSSARSKGLLAHPSLDPSRPSILLKHTPFNLETAAAASSRCKSPATRTALGSGGSLTSPGASIGDMTRV
jgi:predicted MPP superfamily phosphohydrolase